MIKDLESLALQVVLQLLEIPLANVMWVYRGACRPETVKLVAVGS